MKGKRLLALLLSLVLALSLLPILPVSADDYDLYVAGIKVTAENAADILGNGEASYDVSGKTLTIYKDITTDNKVIYNYYVSGLTIKVANNVTLVSTGANAIDLYDTTTITGPGALTVRSYAGSGFYLHYAGSTFQGMNIDVSGTEYGVKSTTDLTVSGGCLHATGSSGAIISSTLTMDGVSILNPAGGSFTDGKVVDAGGSPALDATIGSMEYYKLYVAGKQVTTANASDILGGGEASYNAIENTLTIRKDITTDQRVIYNYDTPGLKIYVANDVTLHSTGFYAVDLYETTTITGPGKLTAISDAEAGIYLHYAPSYFTEANIDASGANYGVHSTTDLTVEAGTLHAAGPNGALVSASLTLYDVSIMTPAGGSFTYGRIVDAGGNPATDVLITGLRQYDLSIAGTQVTNLNAADVLGNGVFSYNAGTETLTVNDSYTYTGDDELIENVGIAGLTIWVASDVTLQTKEVGILLYEDTLLTGPGKLELASSDSWGIQWWEDVVLTVQSATADVTGFKALAARGGMVNVNLAVYDGSLLSLHSTYGAVVDTGDCHTITIGPGLTILDPAGCEVKTEGGKSWFENTNGSKPSSVTIGPVGAVINYDLWIAGVQVSSANASDPLGDGAFSYDVSSKTLTLKKDCTVTGISEEVVESEIDGLTVYVANDVTLTGDYDELYLKRDTTVTGPGKLTLVDTGGYSGIDVYDADDVDPMLTIRDANIEANCASGIAGNECGEQLEIINSTVHSVATNPYGAINGFTGGITLDGCLITAPAGAVNDGVGIMESDGTTPALEVTIEPVVYYDLYIAGEQVSSLNAADVLGDGAFSYNAAERILTVKKNCTTDQKVIYNNDVSDLTVYVENDVTLVSTGAEAIDCYEKTVFTGPGKLTVRSDTSDGMYLHYGTTTFKDANIDVTGAAYGINCPTHLTVDNSTVHAVGPGYAVCVSGDFTLVSAVITAPEGGSYQNPYIMKADGVTPATEATIAPLVGYDLYIAGVQVTELNADDPLSDGAFSYDAGTKTLTIKKDCTVTGIGKEVVNSDIDGLTITVESDVTLTGDYDELFLKGNTTITGPGKLTLVDVGGYWAIDCYDSFDIDPTLTIRDADIDASGSSGISANECGEQLEIVNSSVHAVGTNATLGAVYGFTGGVTLSGCEITAPTGAVIVDGCILESDGTTPAGEVTISLPPTPTYTVSFNANGHGTAPAAQTVEEGKTATEPAALTAEGWDFGGWYEEAACTNEFDFSTPITADITLYAKWTETPVYYTVTFNANGHGTAPAAQTVLKGMTATEPAEPTAEGWNFGGWYTESACANEYVFVTPVTEDITLYAKWTEKPIYDVTFHSEHGTYSTWMEHVYEGATVAEPAVQTDPNWTFEAWYTDEAFTAKYDFSAPVTANLDLYAKWIEIVTTPTCYTVTFDANGHGTAPAAQTVEEGKTAAEPAAPTAEGWTFGGWYEEAACTNKFDFATPITADLTLYAKWTENVTPPTYYTVTFDANGHGTAPEAAVVEAGQPVPKPAYLAADGWVFGGWYTEPECINAYDFSLPVTADFTLYAKWTEDKPGELENPFEDVTKDDYFFAPVLWAYYHTPQITTGTSATRFSPGNDCTRAQIVTFLWRAKGCPEPTLTESPFVDVQNTSDYYYKSVLWAVENGITTGSDATHFSPNKGCTRAQVVTFQWRANGKPAPSTTENPFSDVKAGQYYYDAVLWAVGRGVTTGTTATTFSPDRTCTRGQIVTFLYRDLA